MSYFVFEKEQVNCNCFDSSPHSARRIFRSQSYVGNSCNNNQKKELSVRNVSDNGKNKKKSLKKQKPLLKSKSTKDQKQKIQTETPFSNEPTLCFSNHEQKMGPKIVNLGYLDQEKVCQIKVGRLDQNKSYRTVRGPLQKAHQPISQFFEQDINKQKKFNQYYDRKIVKEFEKDFQLFQMEMRKQQKSFGNSDYKPRKKSISPQKKCLQSNQNLSKIDKAEHSFQFHSIPLNSGFYSNRQKASLSKRNRSKMVLKEIQSQKDGSSSDSDKQSQVVGRGWEDFTESVADLQQLQDLTKKKYLKTETMVTQQSNIRSSQIKTGTQFSNSLISPKSQQNICLKFGGMHKYGQAGMSYQNIDEFLSKQKQKQRFKFDNL